jgi:Pentapeptide repeats (8 copies)
MFLVMQREPFSIGLTITVLIAGVCIAGLLWFVPRWQVRNIPDLAPKERFDKENEARKTLAQIIGGVLVLVSLFSAAETLRVSQQQAAIAANNAKTAADQLRVAQDGQITGRFVAAIEQLGNKKDLRARLGAIYGLERVATESDRDYWPVMEILSSYVREERSPTKPGSQGVSSKEMPPPPADVVAAMNVIGRRAKAGLEFQAIHHLRIDLTGVNLMDLYLRRANLTAVDLRGAHLERANMFDCEYGDVDLSEARLGGARLQGADLSGAELAESYLDGALLDGATLPTMMMGTRLRAVSLRKVKNICAVKFDKTTGDDDTDVPDCVNRPPEWRTGAPDQWNKYEAEVASATAEIEAEAKAKKRLQLK